MLPKVALGYTEFSNQSREEARADVITTVFVRSETIPVVQAAATFLSLSGFEVHNYVLFLAKPFNSLDEFVTLHEIACPCARV